MEGGKKYIESQIFPQRAQREEKNLEAMICKHLGIPAPEPQKKGILSRFFKK